MPIGAAGGKTKTIFKTEMLMLTEATESECIFNLHLQLEQKF